MERIEIKTRIEQAEFTKLQYWLYYKKPIVIIFTLIGLFIIGYVLWEFIHGRNQALLSTPAIFGFVIVLFLPFSVWFRSKRAFKTNKNLQEEMIYTFNERSMEIKGETFESKLLLKNLYKFKETNTWLLLYQSKNTFHIIPKRSTGQAEMIALRDLLDG